MAQTGDLRLSKLLLNLDSLDIQIRHRVASFQRLMANIRQVVIVALLGVHWQSLVTHFGLLDQSRGWLLRLTVLGKSLNLFGLGAFKFGR